MFTPGCTAVAACLPGLHAGPLGVGQGGEGGEGDEEGNELHDVRLEICVR
jgi:hypothetical protein